MHATVRNFEDVPKKQFLSHTNLTKFEIHFTNFEFQRILESVIDSILNRKNKIEKTCKYIERIELIERERKFEKNGKKRSGYARSMRSKTRLASCVKEPIENRLQCLVDTVFVECVLESSFLYT